MNEIKCPKCGTMFQIDETEYSSIVKQIRDSEFEKEIKSREQHFLDSKESAIKIAEATISEKLKEKINKKTVEITELQNQIKLKDGELILAVQTAISEKEKIINNLNNILELSANSYLLKEKTIKESYEEIIKDKDEQISYYKDFKAKQSTKMIGESLEQHCNTEFNRLRPLFKNAYFEKDNDASGGTKGDFIFRDYDDDGFEKVSIMFEMKNEADETATKHKNDDFLKKLDKDRKEKKCEYAVLVSLLEIDNELYNNGIVDESYKYDKMYVIRPQFFIPLITLITGIVNKSMSYKKELELVKNQNIDISNFEENINVFKETFGKNYRIASDKFKKAIEEIDKTIDHLQKTKDALLSSENNLRLANNKAEDLTIKKLTRNSETVAQMFKDLNK